MSNSKKQSNSKSQSSSKNQMSRRQLIKEISHVTQLKPEIVESVLKAFTDIFIREVVLRGKFTFTNCFSVFTKKRKERSQYNVNKGVYQDYPETKYLTIRLSKKILGFHRWKQRHEYNEKHGLTIEDWQNREGPEIPK